MVEILIPTEKRYFKLVGDRKAVFQNGEINGCCQQPDSLYLDHWDEERKVYLWRCRVCKRAHYVLPAEPGHFGLMELMNIGGKK